MLPSFAGVASCRGPLTFVALSVRTGDSKVSSSSLGGNAAASVSVLLVG